MGVKYSNNATTTLDGSITDSATSFDVADASVFPAISSPDVAYLTIIEGANMEIVQCTDITSNTLTVVRGVDGTSGTAFSTAVRIDLRMTKAMLDDLYTELSDNTDLLSSVSANDTTPGYLNGKLTAGTDITLTEGSDGGNETLDIAVVNLVIGTDIQAQSAGLDDLDTVGPVGADGEFLVGTSAGVLAWESGATARTSLGLTIGTNVQAFHAALTDLADVGVVGADSEFLVGTGAGTLAWENAATALISIGALAAGDTSIGIHSVPISAIGMYSPTTAGAEAGAVESSTYKVMLKTMDFDAASQEYAQFQIPMPSSWDESSTITAIFNWSHPTATAYDVIWGIEAISYGNSDGLDATDWGTGVEVTDSGGTTDDLFTSAATSGMTPAGSPATNDHVIFRVYRKAADGSDTLDVDARLHSVLLNITTAAAVDA